MMKRVRELAHKIEAEGFFVEDWGHTGSSHLRFLLISPQGRQIRLVAPMSPGDWRGVLNMTAALRRIRRIESIVEDVERERQLKQWRA